MDANIEKLKDLIIEESKKQGKVNGINPLHPIPKYLDNFRCTWNELWAAMALAEKEFTA